MKTTATLGTVFTLVTFAPLLTGFLLVARASYKNRERFRAVCMSEFYDWSAELRAGGDPWSSGDVSYRPPAGVIHRGECNYPPLFLRAFEPLTLMPPVTAYWVWQSILIASLMVATLLMMRELGPPAGVAPYALALGAALMLPEVYGALYESEPTLLLLALLVAAWICDRRERSWAAGLMLALAALLKIYPALAGGYFLARRRWATIAWTIAFGIAGLVLSNIGDQRRFLNASLLHSVWLSDDRWLRNDRSIATLSNIRTVLDWLYGRALPHEAFGLWYGLTAAADILLLVPSFYLTFRTSRDRELDAPCFGLWLCAAIMISPIAWGHYLPLLIPLLLGVAMLMMRRPRFNTSGALMLALGLIGSTAAYFWSPLCRLHAFFIATLLMYLGACLLVSGWNTDGELAAR